MGLTKTMLHWIMHEKLADSKANILFIKSNFRYLKERLNEQGITSVDGVIFDLGVSSPQLDTPERGFSYHHDAPLDMRMDQTAALSAKQVVNEWPFEDLVRIFYKYGEEKFSKQIARKIEEARKKRQLKQQESLSTLLKKEFPHLQDEKADIQRKEYFKRSELP